MSRNGRITAFVLTGLIAAGAMAARWSVSQEKPAAEPGKQPTSPAKSAPPAKEPPSVDAAAAEQAILQKLEEPTELNFNETPLREVLERLGKKHKLQIFPLVKKLEEANVQMDTPITRSLSGVNLRQGLSIVFHDLGLKAIVRDDLATGSSSATRPRCIARSVRSYKSWASPMKAQAAGVAAVEDSSSPGRAEFARIRGIGRDTRILANSATTGLLNFLFLCDAANSIPCESAWWG